jgi:uncharacterized protein YndB with AHSA1/START domain
MKSSSTDRIVKTVEIKAPVSRVWRALTDYGEFGEWFRVRLEGPFVVGKMTRGRVLSPGYEHMVMEVVVQKMEPKRLFSYTWHPHAVNPAVDYSTESPTLVEFVLEEIPGGTRLTVTESGFDRIPAARRGEAFRLNSGGWEEQMRNIAEYVTKDP